MFLFIDLFIILSQLKLAIPVIGNINYKPFLGPGLKLLSSGCGLLYAIVGE